MMGTATETTMNAVNVPMLTMSHRKLESTQACHEGDAGPDDEGIGHRRAGARMEAVEHLGESGTVPG